MSLQGSSSGRPPPKKDKGKSPALSKPPVSKSPVTGTVTPFGPLVPHPSYPGISVPVSSSPSSKFQVLGHIPKPYSSVLASQPREIDPFCDSSNPINQTSPLPKKSDYELNFQANLFHIEPFMKPKNNPSQLAAEFFPPGWHFAPFAPHKGLVYYKDILVQTESILIKPIFDKNDSTKIIFHSLYIKRILSQLDWGCPPSNLRRIDKPTRPIISDEQFNYSYFDYMDAWSRILLHQNAAFSHSWFIQFDHKFKSQIPFWFTNWWSKFGPRSQILPPLLRDQVTYFSHRAKPIQNPLIPILLQFMSKYKIPWILRWQYSISSPINASSSSPSSGPAEVKIIHYGTIPAVSRSFYVKWWDKFNVQRIIGQVQAEFPPVNLPNPTCTSTTLKSSKSSASLHLSDIEEYSASELQNLLEAVQKRQSKLSKNSSNEDDEVSPSSSSSQASVNQDPFGSQFQDAQDPFA